MAEFRGKLMERIKRTPSVESFRFSLEKEIAFAAGQFLCVMFDEQNKNNRELNKYLSFSSSPGKDYIEVTKRLSDSQFSGKLKNLKAEDTVLFNGPYGNCVLKEEDKKIGFLVGGIGVTPVMSIIEYVGENNLSVDLILLYSNRTEDEIAFKNELDRWKAEKNNIKVIYILTDSEPIDKQCIKGRISKELIIEKVKDIKERLFFVFGPPKMVEAMKNLCFEAGCAKEKIKTESFIGY